MPVVVDGVMHVLLVRGCVCAVDLSHLGPVACWFVNAEPYVAVSLLNGTSSPMYTK